MILIEREFKRSHLVQEEALSGMAFTGEDGGHKFIVRVKSPAGEAETLTGSVVGKFVREDGVTVELTAAEDYAGIENGAAWVILAANCYTQAGPFRLTITNIANDETRNTVCAFTGYVRTSETGEIVDPENVINVDAIVGMIDELQDAIEDAEAASAFVPALQATINGGERRAYDVSLWVLGGISSSNGTNSNSSTRMRTGYLNYGVDRIEPASGYKFIVAAYDADNSDTYIGMWNGTTFAKAASWNTSAVDLFALSHRNYKYRLVAAKTGDGELNVATDAQNIILYSNTDLSLTQSGIPADAKAAGDAVSMLTDGDAAGYAELTNLMSGRRNMFDYTDAGCTRYQYIGTDGTIHSGTSSTFGNYYTSHPITVGKGTYKFTAYEAAFTTSAGTVGVFDLAGNLVGKIEATVTNDVATLTVDRVCRICFNTHKNIIAQAVFCEASLWDGAYHPFEKSIKNELLDLNVGKDETDFFLRTRGTNLLDLRGGISGKYFNAATGTKSTGTLSSYSGVSAYYVRLDGAGNYVTEVAKGVYGESNAKYLALYDKNKRYLTTITGTVTSVSDSYEAPCAFEITAAHIAAGAVYLGLTVYDSYTGSVMVVKGTTYPSSFIPYAEKWTVPDLTVEPSQLGDMTGQIGKDETDFFTEDKSDNLLDLSDPVEDKYFNASNGALTSISSSYSVESVYVKLDGAGTYVTKADYNLYGSNTAKVCLFDASKTYVTTVTGTLGSTSDVYGVPLSFEVTDAHVAAGAVYAGLTLYKPYAGTLMFVKDDEYPGTYEPYRDEWTIPDLKLTAGQAPTYTPNPLYGKKAVFDGDSICAASTDTSGKGAYAGRIAAANSMGYANYAVGGGTITAGISGHYCISGNVDTIYASHPDADYVIFEGGTNDADLIGRIVDDSGQPITPPSAFGSFSPADFSGSYDSATFCGAVETMLFKALSHWPHAKIGYVCGPKMRETRASNTTMLNRMAYWKTAVEICKKWGVPYINLCEKWHSHPMMTMYYDSTMTTAENREAGHFYGDGQHPTPTGYDDMSGIIEAWMRTL